MKQESHSSIQAKAFSLKTKDGQIIASHHYQRGHPSAVILAHGFFNNKNVYLFRKLADAISKTYDVITFDFRGHGESSGLFGWTAREQEEMELIVRYSREQGYQRLGVIGFSLGAAISLIYASQNQGIDAVISVSAPFDFWEIDFHFWEPEMLEDLKLNIGFKGKGKGIRPGNPFYSKIKPLDVIEALSPTPVLFIHGQKDWLIKPRHSQKLFQRARDPKRIVIIPKAGHAEKIYDSHPEEFLNLCFEWFAETLR